MEDQKPLNEVKQLVADAIIKFREEHIEKSFAGRHPEFGKMIKCQICSRRHREFIKCEQKILTPAANTRKGIFGAARFAKQRIHPHINQRNNLLINLTRELFSKHTKRFPNPEDAMMSARAEARMLLFSRYREIRRIKNQQQKESRRINRGL